MDAGTGGSAPDAAVDVQTDAGLADGSGKADATGGTGCGNTNLPPVCNTTTTGTCKIDVAGTSREYFLVLPNNYNPNTPYPLFFAWHGATHYATELLDSGRSSTDKGFFRVRESMPDAIYVAAQGLVGDPGNVTGWPNTNGRDVAFVKAMIASFDSTYCVDKSRIFSTGASFGGMMSMTLACQMPDVFRAVGVMCGSGGGGNCGKNPIAAWFHHGDADMTVPISGGMGARDSLIKRNGCSTTNTQTEVMPDGVTTCTIYKDCTSGNYPVVWCPVAGLGHSLTNWAGSQQAKFFKQF